MSDKYKVLVIGETKDQAEEYYFETPLNLPDPAKITFVGLGESLAGRIFDRIDDRAIRHKTLKHEHSQWLAIVLKTRLREKQPQNFEQGRGRTAAIGVDATLNQRGNKYGDFYEHARITQNIKAAMVDTPNWEGHTTPAMREALEMVAHKIGRILNGDPNFHDSWHDMIGYIRLIEKDLTPEPH